MTTSYRVTVDETDTVLMFTNEAPALAEFRRRRDKGQLVYLESGTNDGRGPVDFDILRAWHDPDDSAPSVETQPWPNEDQDMERLRGIEVSDDF